MRTLILLLALGLTGCETAKRNMMAEKCEQRVEPLVRMLGSLSANPTPGKALCGCLATRIDMAKVERIAALADEARRDAMALLLIEELPLVRTCARETGILKK